MLGIVQTSVLTDVANAIRQKNGTAEKYRPGDMAAAVLALDGTSAGAPGTEAYKDVEEGMLSSAVLEDIASAIRTKNGSSEEYLPGELAPAILALSFDVGLKIRALLLDDGTLELNYRSVRSSSHGGQITEAWEVPVDGYDSPTAPPWMSHSDDVVRIVLDDDLKLSGLQCADWMFSGMESVVEVFNPGALQGVPSVRYLFYNCRSLVTIWADGYQPVEGQLGGAAVSGCSRLIGGRGGTASAGDGTELFNFGESGVLTDPDDDQRQWFRAFLYDDGELVMTAAESPDPGRTLVARDEMCANVSMDHIISWPWGDDHHAVKSVTIAEDMASYPVTNTSYWFYEDEDLASVSGISNLTGTRLVRGMFCGCTSLVTVDLGGFDPSSLTDVGSMFYQCGALTTIYADSDWELPSDAEGYRTFQDCESLVGGNGTQWSYSKSGGEYLRIDRAGQAGYLTEKP